MSKGSTSIRLARSSMRLQSHRVLFSSTFRTSLKRSLDSIVPFEWFKDLSVLEIYMDTVRVQCSKKSETVPFEPPITRGYEGFAPSRLCNLELAATEDALYDTLRRYRLLRSGCMRTGKLKLSRPNSSTIAGILPWQLSFELFISLEHASTKVLIGSYSFLFLNQLPL